MFSDHDEGERSAEKALEGKYSNYFEIGHNAFEFLLDFGQKYSGGAQERIHSRIIMGPSYAKELLNLLEKSIDEHERAFGMIRVSE
jgi:hypothetical protein